MENLNLFRPLKERENRQLLIQAKSYPLYLAVRMRRYGSLIIINPSGLEKVTQSLLFALCAPFSIYQSIYTLSCRYVRTMSWDN